MDQRDVIVIGGGAAGLMCAIEAGKRGRRVLVIDHANRIGKKILLSGGGRCNFTNLHAGPANFLSANPHFCKSALSRYRPSDFIALVEKHGVAYHEKKLGQLFCNHSAKDIVALLADECRRAGVQILTQCSVDSVTRNTRYALQTSRGEFSCESLVIASGGLSFPTMGATGFGYRIAEQFDLKVLPTRAALVPFTFDGELLELANALAGISLDSIATIGKTAFHENLLFTHRGISGPAVLQISSYWHERQTVTFNLLPDLHAADWLLQSKQQQAAIKLKTLLHQKLPNRFVDTIENDWFGNRLLAEISNTVLQKLGERLNRWSVTPSGTEGYRTAEVTLGGVDTDELSSQTMESKTIPGLYFIGEVVDVTGWLGGYNFQWAWASGHAAGQVA